ncbi:MAG: two-component system, response regulator YesN, partial [Bacillota bacterium]|nr:two-component system, response regulator YesN [Bacillota bacterium]
MRLLIADDEIAVRRLVRFVVERYCPEVCIVGEARDGRELVAKGLECKPDVLLTDIRMPNLDGITAARELKKVIPEVQIVFLTAYEEFGYAREALNLKAESYLVKPIRPEELKKTLNSCAANLKRRLFYRTLTLTMNSALQRSRSYLKSYLFDQLLHGNLDAYEKVAALVGPIRIPKYVLVVSITPSTSRPPARVAVERIVKSLAGDELVVFIEQGEPGLVLGVGGSTKGGEDLSLEWAKQFAAQLKGRLEEEETGLLVTIGIGGKADIPQEVARSFRQAQLALSYSFVLGSGRVIASEDVDRGERNVSFLPLEAQLVAAVRSGNLRAVREAAGEMLLGLRHLALDSPHLAKQLAAETARVLVGVTREAGVEEDQLRPEQLTVEKIREATSFAQLSREFFCLTKNLTEAIRRKKEEESSNVIQQALAFIEANYARDITLQDVAKSVYLSPYYFSRLFRKKTGVNFAKYLSMTRINAAKKLMEEKRLPIKEIAARV